ncbi:MAG: dephospho-CoA kinase [Clostridia bacterium]|nr:dephospho-CoA kinase [Clostridia bacterium]
MRIIGITGSIACGKTTVSRELIRQGFPVIDGDVIARELTSSRGPAVESIRSAFGDRFISPDGSLNRRLMGSLVFSDPAARERLDQVMAPFLHRSIMDRIEEARVSGSPLCFLDMPLLYEKGYDRFCDTVWCVWLPEDMQLQRLMKRDGFSREEALSRMRAVMSSDQKADLSPVVIDNSGSVEDTLSRVSGLLETELSRTRSSARRRRAPADYADEVPASVSRPAPVPSRMSVPDLSVGVERPDSFRRKPAARKASWNLPRWISVSLIALAAVLILSLTSQLLMNAYLDRQYKTHIEEQQAIDRKYPINYTNYIKKSASEFNLSPPLIAAVIMNESSYRPEVESGVGARGLMQLMPDTAEWIAHKLRVDNYSFELLKDPATNIRFGCWYLNYLGSLFNNDPLCVVCAYHAGQGEINGWLANPLYSSDGKTLNYASLPEGPTKLYAGKVIRDYGIYKAKYFTQDNSSDSSGSAPSAP